MNIILPTLAVTFAAFCVWLAVRIFNRRERWAKWLAASMISALIGYPLSFGPACWWFSNAMIIDPGPDYSEVRRCPLVYWPMGYVAKFGPALAEEVIGWYATLGLGPDSAIFLPADANDAHSGIGYGKWLFQ